MKKIWNWIKDKWKKFDVWVARKVPGFKTKLVAAIGAVGSAALVLQEFVAGLPLEQVVTAKTIAIANIVLFTLAFWFRGMARR